MRPRSLALSAALAVLPLTVVGLGVTSAQAAVSPNAASRVALPNTVTPAVAHSDKKGDLPADTRLSVAVSLKLRNADRLDGFLKAVSDKSSPQFGKYLTPAQFTEQFGPSRADVAQVRAYLKAQGLTVTSVSDNRQTVNATGTAAQLAKAFGTHESSYTDPKQGNKSFFANDSAASVPESLSGIVEGISGLNDHTTRTTRIAHPNAATPAATPSGYGPAQYDGAYNLNKVGTDGTGVTVALWEFDGYQSSNLSAYNSQYGLTGGSVQTVSVDGANYDSAPGQGQGEVELDSEIVKGVAPKATQLVYEAPNNDQGEIDMANKIVADNKASVISISWGSCEPDTTAASMTAVDNAFKQAAAQGISIFSASGDDGSKDCTRSTSGASVTAVDFPASSPHNTGVGGTNLQLSGNSYSSESAWSTAGGGTSTQFSKPSWQTGTGVNTTMRTVPDVSSNADPKSGFAIYTAGSSGPGWNVYGGTSAAAPLWAGYTALYNQKAAASGAANLGEANPKLYAVANSSSYGSAFHDVTTGANQDFSAGPGYDQVTGWGTPVADALTTALLGGTTPPPPPAGGITNGDFETGNLNGWTATGSASADASAAQTGGYGALVGSANPSSDSSISQTFTAPTGTSKLAFGYNVTCPDTVTYDWASATLKDNTTGATTTVLANTCTSGLGWQSASAAVTPGHSYTLTLANHDDGYAGDPTYTSYDNVTLS